MPILAFYTKLARLIRSVRIGYKKHCSNRPMGC